MTTVLVVEDDDAIRNNITRLLKLEGYEIAAAINGALGLARARELRPDVIISDIGMPEMDGFQMLEALRADPALSSTPLMLLTALDDRASMRRGMTAGADDYLAKPFTRVELLEAIAGLLKKKERVEQTVEVAVQAHEAQLRRAFSESLAGRRPAGRIGLEAPAGAIVEGSLAAAVLFAEVRHFTVLAGQLSADEVAELLTVWFERACERVLQHGGRHVRFAGDALTAVFPSDVADGLPEPPGARGAVLAGLGLVLAAQEMRHWLARRFAGRALPAFAVGVGLHQGPLALCRTAAGGSREPMAVGEPIHLAARLVAGCQELGWSLVASMDVAQAAGPGVQTGGITALPVLPAGGYLDVAELAGVESIDREPAPDAAGLARRAQELAAALQVNSEITARAVKSALHSKLAALKAHAFAPGQEPLRLRGYRLNRKIGSGGMTEVYLAERESDGEPVVLKVLDASSKGAGEHLARFIQEYALLSRIDHPNVVRIHDQGFTDDHAFIAMEFFPRGDLRSELGEGMSPQRALKVLEQVARALAAIHAHGIIHRDLKPENIMRRADDTVALADFGIAKSLRPGDHVMDTQTRHGDVVGTPFYLSPEQAAGQPITPLSDLYSLGVVFYEMLTGERPYRAESLDALLAQHLGAPTPRLPAEHEGLQPLVDRLMAKRPQDRFAGADALLAELRERSFARTVAGPG